MISTKRRVSSFSVCNGMRSSTRRNALFKHTHIHTHTARLSESGDTCSWSWVEFNDPLDTLIGHLGESNSCSPTHKHSDVRLMTYHSDRNWKRLPGRPRNKWLDKIQLSIPAYLFSSDVVEIIREYSIQYYCDGVRTFATLTIAPGQKLPRTSAPRTNAKVQKRIWLVSEAYVYEQLKSKVVTWKWNGQESNWRSVDRGSDVPPTITSSRCTCTLPLLRHWRIKRWWYRRMHTVRRRCATRCHELCQKAATRVQFCVAAAVINVTRTVSTLT